MHSPVLAGHDPDFDSIDYDGDWDDSADDFYEEGASPHTKKGQRGSGIESPRPRKKQCGLTSENAASLCEPVIWIPLNQRLHPLNFPKRHYSGAEAVALIEDWRELLTEPSPRKDLGQESSLPSVPLRGTAGPEGHGTKRKRGVSESSETTHEKAVAEAAKSLVSPKKKATKQATAGLEQYETFMRENATHSQQETAASFRKSQHRPGQVLKEVRLPPAPLTDGQGNANRRGRPPSKRTAISENEGQSKKKTLAAAKPPAVMKLNRASGRQTRSRK